MRTCAHRREISRRVWTMIDRLRSEARERSSVLSPIEISRRHLQTRSARTCKTDGGQVSARLYRKGWCFPRRDAHCKWRWKATTLRHVVFSRARQTSRVARRDSVTPLESRFTSGLLAQTSVISLFALLISRGNSRASDYIGSLDSSECGHTTRFHVLPRSYVEKRKRPDTRNRYLARFCRARGSWSLSKQPELFRRTAARKFRADPRWTFTPREKSAARRERGFLGFRSFCSIQANLFFEGVWSGMKKAIFCSINMIVWRFKFGFAVWCDLLF